MSRNTRLFMRAMALRCPHCGYRGIFRHWLAMRDVCPNCGLSLQAGNRVGAYILNMAASESLLMIMLLTVIVRRWPTPPWDTLQYLAPALMLVAPLIFYPFSKALFVAIDLSMYPGSRPDPLVHGNVRPDA